MSTGVNELVKASSIGRRSDGYVDSIPSSGCSIPSGSEPKAPPVSCPKAWWRLCTAKFENGITRDAYDAVTFQKQSGTTALHSYEPEAR